MRNPFSYQSRPHAPEIHNSMCSLTETMKLAHEWKSSVEITKRAIKSRRQKQLVKSLISDYSKNSCSLFGHSFSFDICLTSKYSVPSQLNHEGSGRANIFEGANNHLYLGTLKIQKEERRQLVVSVRHLDWSKSSQARISRPRWFSWECEAGFAFQTYARRFSH